MDERLPRIGRAKNPRLRRSEHDGAGAGRQINAIDELEVVVVRRGELGECGARVNRLENTGAWNRVTVEKTLARADVKRVGIVGVHHHRCHRDGRQKIGQRLPVSAAVNRLPHAAAHTPGVHDVGIDRVDEEGSRSPADVAGAEPFPRRGGRLDHRSICHERIALSFRVEQSIGRNHTVGVRTLQISPAHRLARLIRLGGIKLAQCLGDQSWPHAQ